VAKQLRLPHRPRGAVEITGNNVPAHAAISEMVEGGKTAGKRVWRLVAQVGGQPEAEVLGDAGHRRHQHQRIVNRQLHRLASGQRNPLLIDVIHAEDIGNKQPVKQAALQGTRQVQPVA